MICTESVLEETDVPRLIVSKIPGGWFSSNIKIQDMCGYLGICRFVSYVQKDIDEVES